MAKRFLVVGAGFAGSVCARQLADAGHHVTIIDKRDHIGGNAFDAYDAAGVLVHKYGPHIFHTNDKGIFEYLSRFTDWRFYEHRVLANVAGELYPFPINMTTINKMFMQDMHQPAMVERFLLQQVADTFGIEIGTKWDESKIQNSEHYLLSKVGKHLTDVFFRGYTRKQWGMDLSELSKSVAARVPARFNDDDRYFTDTYQFMPANGYGSLFCEMLRHPNIDIRLNTDFEKGPIAGWLAAYEHVVYTGPIDAFFKYEAGKLPYRSLKFEHEHLPFTAQHQPVGTVNEPDYSVPYTRTTEFKHMTGQDCLGTSICREYPTADGDPYYPIPNAANQAVYLAYENEAYRMNKTFTFVGRLAQYKYYNMDQVVASALTAVKRLL
jgi:UDP-galactopyranose mutase